MGTERLWTKSYIFMVVGMFFLFIAFYMLYPTLPLYIKEQGGSDSQVGLAMGTFMIASVMFRPFVGGFIDRFGRRPFIIWGLLCFAVVMYMYNWIGGFVVLMVLRILHGLTWAVSTTSISTAVTDLIPAGRRGEGLGWSGMSMTLAMAVGPMMGLWVVGKWSYSLLFIVAVILVITSLFLTFGAKMTFTPKAGNGKIEIFERKVVPITASVFLLFIAYGGITSFIPLFADSIKVNSGTFFLVYAATLVLSRPLAGKLSDQHGEKMVIIPSLVITVLSLVCLSFATGLGGVLLAAILYGIGFGSAQSAFQASTIQLVSPDRAGVANASFATGADLGIGLGAMILGWISQNTSYQIVFIVSAVSVLLSLAVFYVFVKETRLRENGTVATKTGT